MVLIVRMRFMGLNPFRAGRCLSTDDQDYYLVKLGLNPFRAGRCLSTMRSMPNGEAVASLNPFRAGRCLSTDAIKGIVSLGSTSQSLSSRAMSFDSLLGTSIQATEESQSLSSRAMSFDNFISS